MALEKEVLSKDTEVKILGCIYRNQGFASAVCEHLDFSLFSSVVDKNISKIAIDQFKQHKVIPTNHVFGHELKKLLKRKIIKEDEKDVYLKRYVEIKQIDISDHGYVLEQQLLPFIKKREWIKFVEDAVKKHLPSENFKALEAGADRINNIGVFEQAPTVATFSDEAIDKRYEDRVREVENIDLGGARIPYGIPMLDQISNGGIHKEKDRLIVFAAGPKVGKTQSLVHFANQGSLGGEHVAYFTYETAISVLQDRLDASVTSTEVNGLLANMDTVRDKLKEEDSGRGEIFFTKYSTGSANASTVERDVKRLQDTLGIKIGLVIVDYLDISLKNMSIKDENERDKMNWESYRRVGEDLGCPVLSATQITTKAGDKSIAKTSSILGTTMKIAAVDAMFIISASEKDLKAGKVYITSSNCRTIVNTTFLIRNAYKYGKFFVEMIEDKTY